MAEKEEEVGRLTGKHVWELRAKHNSKRIFSDGDLLLAHAAAYFRWCETHPRYKTEIVKYKDHCEEVEVPLKRLYTIDGLTVYLGVSGNYLHTASAQLREKQDLKGLDERETYLLECIDSVLRSIRNEQIEGGAVGNYKEGFMARLNNLAENVNQHNTGSAVVRVTVRDNETADNLDTLNSLL